MSEGNRSMGTDPTISGDAMPRVMARSDQAELAPDTMVGEYRIEGLLGQGGMGRVYAAVHPVIGKRAAVKVLHPALSVERDAVDRFVQEARAVNQIGHPNIVDIFAFGNLPDGRCYFVMEQLRGESLGARIERAPLPTLDTVAILDTIAIALEAAHRKGIIHRDLKPDNIFLVEIEGSVPQVKLLDFGIAKLVGGDLPLQRTRTGNVMGTPAYISPEQARGQGVDHRTDIYAFGAVAFELLTRRWPFPATNAADMIAKHLFEAPPSAATLNPDVDAGLDHLITSMLAKEVDARPTLAEAREQLRAFRDRVYQRQALHAGGHTDPVIDISHAPSHANDPLALSMPIDPPAPVGVSTHVVAGRRPVLPLIGAAIAIIAIAVGVIVFRDHGVHRANPPAAAPAAPPPPTAIGSPPASTPPPSTPPASANMATPAPAPTATATSAAPTTIPPPSSTIAPPATPRQPITKPKKPARPTKPTGETHTQPSDDPDAPM